MFGFQAALRAPLMGLSRAILLRAVLLMEVKSPPKYRNEPSTASARTKPPTLRIGGCAQVPLASPVVGFNAATYLWLVAGFPIVVKFPPAYSVAPSSASA